MTSYFVSFIPAIEGGYIVLFKDFSNVVSQGADIEECVTMAEDLLSMLADEYTVERKDIPNPSGIENVKAWTLAQMQEDAETVDHTREPFYQLLRMPSVNTKPVRVAVSFPKNILEQIDMKAARLGLTRSKLLAYGALAYEA